MIQIPESVRIHPTARIDVLNGKIGPRTIIEAHAVIEGRYIEIGTESWIGEYAVIGGGSCFDESAMLITGDWFHLGPFAHLNTARGVTLGHEVGIGHKSCIFTHGAYESVLDGFPVQWGEVIMGNRVWLPNAWVNPGVTIGSNVVVAAMSLVNRDLPNNCLAGGIPAKILKEHVYYNSQSVTHEVIKELEKQIIERLTDIGYNFTFSINEYQALLDYDKEQTIFDFPLKVIVGAANVASELVKDQLRRNGIRFRYTAENGEYVRWT